MSEGEPGSGPGSHYLIGRRGGSLCCSGRQLGDGIRHNSRGQDFGEEPRALLSRDIKHVGWHTASAERRQRLRDGVVITGPVGSHKDDVAVGEGFLDFGCAECHALVDLAARGTSLQ